MATSLQFADLERVGPGTPSGRYLRSFWHPVLRAQDLRAGQAKPLEVLSDKFTIYRGQNGTPYIVAFRCAHRGAQLSLGWVEGDAIRCRYHGWKYDGCGQCLEQPDEDAAFAQKVRLRSYPVREYLGLIFAYFGDNEPPPFRTYADFGVPGVIVTDPTELVPCNFWNRLDNDAAHVAWVHRATALRKGRPDFMTLRRESVEETPYGFVSTRQTVGGSDDLRDIGHAAHFFMPNVYQFAVRTRARGFEHRQLWDAKITWTVPINDEAFAAFDVTHTALVGEEGRAYGASRLQNFEAEAEDRWDLAEKILAGEMSIEELPDDLSAYTSFAIEDYVTQVGQGPVSERGPERLGRTDAKPILLRRLWLREVSALVDGRPLTNWQIPTVPIQFGALASS